MSENITIKTSKGDVPGYYVSPEGEGKFPALLLIHEIWGLNDHIKDVANRLASEGYAVLAPDLISHTGVTEKIDQSIMSELANPETRDEAQKKMREAMAPVHSPEFGKETIVRLQDCFEYLLNKEGVSEKIGVLGFCFGGTYAWELAVSHPSLAAAIAFYGHAPIDEKELQKITCPVLAFYGEQDINLIQDVPKIEEIMDRLEKDFDFIIYPNTGHAFFNDTNPARYNEAAAQDSWAKTIAFLKQHMG
jgi:carboxymethylenebutenolidase